MGKASLAVLAVLFALLAVAPGAQADACLSNGNGAWESAGTWTNCSTNSYPKAGDTAEIRNGNIVTVTKGESVAGLTLTSGTVAFSTSEIPNPSVAVSGASTIDSGEVSGPGTLTFNGSLTKTGGGTWSLRTGAPHVIVNAPATHNGGGVCIDDQTNTGAASDPILDVNGVWTMSATASFGCSGNLDNPGLRISATGTLNYNNAASFSTPLLNLGTVNVNSGTLQLQGGLASASHTGHWNIAAAAILYFNGSTAHLSGGDITGTGSAILRTDANLTLDGGVPLNVEDLRVLGGTLTMNGAAALPTDYDNVNFTSGTRSGDRNWTIKNLTIDNADFQGPATTTVSTSLTKTGGGTWSLRTGAPHVIVNAPATHNGGGVCIDDQTNTGAASDPILDVNGAWTMSATASFGCSGNLDNPGLRISATGTLNYNNAASFSTPLLNLGTVNVNSGTLQLQGGLASASHTGHWNIAAAAILYFNGSTAHLSGGDITGTGSAILRTDANLTLDGGVPLNVEDLRVLGGTLTMNGAAALPTDYDNVNFTSGTRSGDRNWTIKNLTIDNADFQGPATTTVSTSLTKTGGGTWSLRTGAPHVIVNAPATHNGGGVCIDDQTNTGAASDPILDVNGAWTMSATASFGCSGNLDNPGLRISATGTLNYNNAASFSTPLLNLGTVNVNSGTLQLQGGLASASHTGHWNIAAAAILYFNGSTAHLSGGDITGTGSAILRTDANLTLDGGVPLNVEDLRVLGGTLTMNGAAALPTDYDNVNFTSGTRSGDRNWTIKNLTIDNADFQGPATTTVSTSLTKTGGGTWSLRTGAPHVIVNAPATHNGGGVCIDDQTNTGAASDPILDVNGAWTMSATASFGCSGNLDNPGLRISATGTLNYNNAASFSTPLLNLGTVNVNSGTLQLQGGLASASHTGHWNIAAAAILYFNGSTAHLSGGDITGTGSAILRTDANLTLDGGVPLNVEDLRVLGGTLTMNGAAALPTDYDNVNFTSGTRSGDRNWTIKNLTIDNADFQGPATTTVSTSLTKTGGGTWSLRTGAPHVIVNAPATHNGGGVCIDDQTNTGAASDPILDVNGAWTMSATASFGCSGNLDNPGLRISATGTLTVGDAGTKSVSTPVSNAGAVTILAGRQLDFGAGFTQSGGTTTANGTFNGSATFTGGNLTGTGTKSGTTTIAGGTLSPSSGTFTLTEGLTTTSGTVQADAGEVLQVNAASTQSGGSVGAASGGTLSATAHNVSGGELNAAGTVSGAVTLTGTGVLKGTGQASGDVTNTSGTVRPGASPGVLSIGGDFAQGAGGTLEIEVNGTGSGSAFDLLSVGGAADLAGTLAILRDGGFDPQNSDTFQFLTSASRSGTFETVTGAGLSGGRSLGVTYPGSPSFGARLVVQTGAPPENTAPPQISGTPQVGQELTCLPGTWTNSPTFTHEWLRDGSAISGAASDTYTVQGADATHQLSCRVTASNAGGDANATSSTVSVPAVGPANSLLPSVSGTPEVGQLLTCNKGSWTGAPAPTLSVQWLRDGGSIPGAASDTYTLQDADATHQLSCRVTASNTGGDANATSSAVNVGAVAPANAQPPSLSGTSGPGQTLTCNTGSWTGAPAPTLSVQWLRDGAPIAGATSSSYTVQDADVGHQLACRVTAGNAGGDATATSAALPVTAVAPANSQPPAVSGTPAVGQVLTCETGSWAGTPAPTLALQWLRDGEPIAGATQASYTVTAADAGHTLACRVTATNSAGSSETTSAGVSVAAAATKVPVVKDFITAVFVPPTLYLRLKCPARFKPGCTGTAVALTSKDRCTSRGGKRRCTRGTPITNTARATQKAGRWKIVPLVVKPNFVSTVLGMADHPDQRLLVVKQQIHAKRFHGGRPEAVFHVYRVQKTTAF